MPILSPQYRSWLRRYWRFTIRNTQTTGIYQLARLRQMCHPIDTSGYRSFRVVFPGARQQLISYLTQLFPQQPPRDFYQTLRRGNIHLNLKPARADSRLRQGDLVELWMPTLMPFTLTAQPKVQVHYCDKHLAIVHKPQAVLSHPLLRRIAEPSLAGSLIELGLVDPTMEPFIHPGMVHRLDRWTSGLVVVGRTQKAVSLLLRMFRKRRIAKNYRTVVSGKLERATTLSEPIARDHTNFWKFKVSDRGKQASTSIIPIAQLPNATELCVRLHTGRTHQIRVHLSHAGHPVVGDLHYGGIRPQGFMPLMLHAGYLGFFHPVTKKWMEFSAPPSEAYQQQIQMIKQGALLQL